MIVYRVELRHTPIRYKEDTKEIQFCANVGPYDYSRHHNDVNCFSNFSLSWYARDTMPGPKEENLEFEQGRDIFGFVNLDKLRTWWKRDHSDLQAAGFYIAEYKIDRRCVSISPTQCAFRKKKARLVAWYELSEVFADE